MLANVLTLLLYGALATVFWLRADEPDPDAALLGDRRGRGAAAVSDAACLCCRDGPAA